MKCTSLLGMMIMWLIIQSYVLSISFWLWAHPVRGGITMKCLLSLADPIPRMTPEFFLNITRRTHRNVASTNCISLELCTQSFSFFLWLVTFRFYAYFLGHYNDVKWARWHLKSQASQLFTQLFVKAQIKENIKAPYHWPFWGESTGDW